MLEEVWSPDRSTFLTAFAKAYSFNVLLKSTLTGINFIFSAGWDTILVRVPSFPITLFHALPPSLFFLFLTSGGRKVRERDGRRPIGCLKTDFFHAFFEFVVLVVPRVRRQKTRQENGIVKRMHGMEGWQQRDRGTQSVGERNGDQYGTTVREGEKRQAGKQTELEDRGGVTEGEKE